MPLFDVVAPQLFADRGGLLGRLLSLRPDLADEQDAAQSPQGDGASEKPNNASAKPAPSAIGSALDDFWRQSILQPIRDIPGYFNDAINDPEYFAHGVGASLAGLGPIARQLPAVARGVIGVAGLVRSATSPATGQPLEIVGSQARDTRAVAVPISPVGFSGSSGVGSLPNGILPGLGLAAAFAGRKSDELLAGAPQPIAPVFPEPPAPPEVPQLPWLSPEAAPVAPQTLSAPSLANPVAPKLGPIPQGASERQPASPSSDYWEQALGPGWQGLRSFIDNTRDKGPAVSAPETDAEKEERCRKQEEAAIEHCSQVRRDDNRNMLAGSREFDECKKAFLSWDCGGYDPRNPEYFFPPYSYRYLGGRGK